MQWIQENGSGYSGILYYASGDVIQSFWSSFFQKACGSRAEPSSLSAESETPPAFQKRGKRGLGGRNPEGGVFPHSPIFCTAEYKNAKCKSISITPRFSHSFTRPAGGCTQRYMIHRFPDCRYFLKTTRLCGDNSVRICYNMT